MRNIKLTRQEKTIEENLLKGEYVDIDKDMFTSITHAIASRKKNAVLNIRVNSNDLENIKQRAKRMGIKYQTFLSEIIHRIAQSH